MKNTAKTFSNDELVIMFIGNVEDYMLGEDNKELHELNKELHEFIIESLYNSEIRYGFIDFQYSDLSISEIEREREKNS